MSVEPFAAIALSGTIGVAFGAATATAWFAAKREEHRLEFLQEFGAALDTAMAASDGLLSNMDLPKDIRIALIRLLAAHANTKLGSQLADEFIRLSSQRTKEVSENNPLTEAMAGLAANNRSLARTARETLSTLAMGLLVVHKGDAMQVEKVQKQASKDPERLLDKIFQTSRGKGAPPPQNAQ